MAVKRQSASKVRQGSRTSDNVTVSSKRSEPPEARPQSRYNEAWAPTPGLAFKLLMSARLCAALWSLISDCDETFNYWEPAHYLVYGQGFQTWEYSPVYAIRSYAYILMHAGPIRLCTMLLGGSEKILIFYMTRCLLGLACAGSEMVFYKGILHQFGPNVARLTLVLQLFAAGMFVSSSAFLPSSFSMYLTMLAYGTWTLQLHQLSILCIAASTILGWPFAAALGVPIAVDVFLLQRRPVYFIKWCFVALILFLVPSVLIDQHYYGKLVVAPLNIVMYNVFSGHGPELYGTEPLSFYLINGFLNYNMAFFLALGSLPFLLLMSFFIPMSYHKKKAVCLSMAPMYIWVLIFFTRPHKEERFLFPIYPFLALGAALVLDTLQRLLKLLLSGSRSVLDYTRNTNWLSLLFCLAFSCLGLARIVALRQAYHASISIYVELNQFASDPEQFTPPPANSHINVCVGKEWHRFPSSFFLPNERWRLQFVQSEFKGLLPAPFFEESGGTKIIPAHMNDLNREEPSRYVNISRCHYLIDRRSPDWTSLEPHYSDNPDWTVVREIPFLDAARSHNVFRAFYIPFLSETKCAYTPYQLLKAANVADNAERKANKHSSSSSSKNSKSSSKKGKQTG